MGKFSVIKPPSSERKVMLTATVGESQWEWVQRAALANRVNVSQFVRQALAYARANYGGKMS